MSIVRRPFKGAYFYEWQIGPFVFQIRHNKQAEWFPLVHMWRDRMWRWPA